MHVIGVDRLLLVSRAWTNRMIYEKVPGVS